MEADMAEHMSDDNPLEEAAADLGADLERERVDVKDSAFAAVQGGHVSMTDSAARSVDAQALDMTDSAAGFVQTKSLEMRDAAVGMAVSEQTTVHSGTVGLLVSGRVKAEELCTGLLVAGKVEGDVKTILSPLSALAIGAGFGLVVMLLHRLVTRNRSHREHEQL
jgi:hypothetical protein